MAMRCGVKVWIGLALATAYACGGSSSATRAEVDDCSTDADCPSLQVCEYDRCHAVCVVTADCDGEARCVRLTEERKICQLSDEVECDADRDCGAPLVCGTDGKCRNECDSNSDCVRAQVCAVSGVCAEPEEVDRDGNLVDGPGAGTGRSGGSAGSGVAASAGASGAGAAEGGVSGDGGTSTAGASPTAGEGGDGATPPVGGTAGSDSGGNSGTTAGATGGSSDGGTGGATAGGSGGSPDGGTAGTTDGGSGGSPDGGTSGTTDGGSGGTGGVITGGTGGVITGGTGGVTGGIGGVITGGTGGVITGGTGGVTGGTGGGGSGGTGGGGSGGTGGGGTGGIDCGAGMPTGGQLHSGNGQGGSGNLSWQIWSNTGNGSLTTFDTPAFSASWSNSGDYLGRLGFEWGSNAQPYTAHGTISAQFTFTKTGSGGDYSVIGVYGWSTNPCIEWYIVDDSYDPMPVNPGNTSNHGTVDIDGGSYIVYTRPTSGTGGSRCGGVSSWTQYYSVRTTGRQCGQITVTQHFDAWTDLGMPLGDLLEAKILVETLGGTGSIDFPIANVTTTQ